MQNENIYRIEIQVGGGGWQVAIDLDGHELTFSDFGRAMTEAQIMARLVEDDTIRVREFKSFATYSVVEDQ